MVPGAQKGRCSGKLPDHNPKTTTDFFGLYIFHDVNNLYLLIIICIYIGKSLFWIFSIFYSSIFTRITYYLKYKNKQFFPEKGKVDFFFLYINIENPYIIYPSSFIKNRFITPGAECKYLFVIARFQQIFDTGINKYRFICSAKVEFQPSGTMAPTLIGALSY